VDHQEELVVEFEHDPLADAAHAAHRLARHRRKRRVVGAQQERREHLDLSERTPDHVALEALEVGADVGQLGHAPS
jgi:hypothetical protein